METPRKTRIGLLRKILRSLLRLWHCEGPQGAAAVSFFSLFTLFPLMLALLAFTDQILFIFGARDAAFRTLRELFPGMRGFLQQRWEEMTPPSGELLFFCLLIVYWPATWIFDFLESAMNRAWGVTRRRGFLHSRLLALWLILLCGTLFLLSTCATVIVTQLTEEVSRQQPWSFFSPWLFTLSKWVLAFFGFLFTLLVFLILYKVVPYTSIRFHDAFRGAILAAPLWQIANYLFAFLLPYLEYQKIYGSIGTMMALLSWDYFSSMIILLGIHYSAVYKEEDALEIHREG